MTKDNDWNNADELEEFVVNDRKRALEHQKELADSFKQYFGSYEVIIKDTKELEDKLNDFLIWRNKIWIVPGKGKTPEQLWLNTGNLKLKHKRIKISNRFSNDMAKFGLIANLIYGLVMVPFYDLFKKMFEGDYKSIPDYLGFFCDIIVETDSFIPSFILLDIISKNQERALILFKAGYSNVKNMDDVLNILKSYRKDWDFDPLSTIKLINTEKKTRNIGLIDENHKFFKGQRTKTKFKDKPLEIKLTEKVTSICLHKFPREMDRAYKEYIKENKKILNKITKEVDFCRGLTAWFLLEHKLLNGLTPMQFAFSNQELFNKEEIDIIENFLSSIHSLFELKTISNDKKDYLLKEVINDNEYVIETIDFPPVIKERDFVEAIIVKKLSGNYFFYGNVISYSRKDGLKIKKFLPKK